MEKHLEVHGGVLNLTLIGDDVGI